MIVSVAVHLSILLVMLPALAHRPPEFEPAPIGVSLVDGAFLLPAPAPAPAPAAAPTPPEPTPPKPPEPVVKPTPARPLVRRATVRPVIEAAAAAVEAEPEGAPPAPAMVAGLSEGELASATTADSGPAGRSCNMPRLLQNVLRKDPKIQAAVAQAHRMSGPGSRAIVMWKGDWVRSHDQEGAGLAGVREAMMLGIAFAPEACRKEPVRGLVLISLNDAPGAARLALGDNEWKWSDLLTPRGRGRVQ